MNLLFRFQVFPFLFAASLLLAAPSRSEEPAMKIGFILPRSGPLQEYGQAISNGVEMVQKEIPVSRRCGWIFEDSKYEPKEAVSAFQRLVDQENVNLLYVFGGPITEAVAPLAESKKIPLISSESEPRFSIGRKYILRFNSPSEEFGKRLSEYFKKNKFRKLGLVRTENQYIDGILRGLRSVLPEDIVIDELQNFLPSDSDFRTSVQQLRSKQYDALGIFLLGYQASTFLKQMEEQRISIPKFGLDFFESATVIQASGPGAEGVVFPSNDPSERFHEDYLKRYKNDAELHWAGFGFDFAKLITERFCGEDSPKRNADQIINWLSAAGVREGKNGTYQFRASEGGDKYFEFPIVLRQIKNGRPVTLAPMLSQPSS